MSDFIRKQALPDELLLQVQKPARYLGNEMNAVLKDRNIPIRFVMCFPDLYEIGMSHLGIQILYELFNRREDTWCERVFSPWIDMDRLMRDHHIPLFALESQDPVRDFDFLGITLQFELCYANILQILREYSSDPGSGGNPSGSLRADGRGSDRDRRRPLCLQSGAGRSFF